jgi:8-oxo-dGTP pyrophosphatase MutT (NUDIX family)
MQESLRIQAPEFMLELQDNEWTLEGDCHDRLIARAVVFDEAGFLYFVRVNRDDEFGKARLIETSGGGVEPGEDLEQAIRRELKEEIGAEEIQIGAKLGVVSDYYNLICRHNCNHYFLCRVTAFGDNCLTQDEIECFHLSTIKTTYVQALEEYERCRDSKLGRLVANREVPMLRRAKELIDGDGSFHLI